MRCLIVLCLVALITKEAVIARSDWVSECYEKGSCETAKCRETCTETCQGDIDHGATGGHCAENLIDGPKCWCEG
ncbi:hypothetical protein AAVH_22711 [Aphelenchoides avenae]|nr:hypothetical protein AAVH_22711 [Aphelenchus avenae]